MQEEELAAREATLGVEDTVGAVASSDDFSSDGSGDLDGQSAGSERPIAKGTMKHTRQYLVEE